MKLLVITPTLGMSPFLQETRASVAALTMPHRHLLVCPREKMDELRGRFPMCEIVEDAGREGGLYGALNAGIRRAAGDWEWFTFINDDDRLGPGFPRYAAAHIRDGNVDVVGYGDVRMLDESGQNLGLMSVERAASRFVPLLDGGISPVSQQGMIFSRRLVEELGGYHAQWRLCGDQDFWVRALRAGFRFRYYPQEVGAFRIRQGQLSSDGARVREEMDAITRKHFPKRTPWLERTHVRWRFRARNGFRIASRLLRPGGKRNAELLSPKQPRVEGRRQRPVLINGLGCLEAGSRGVLRELMKTFPPQRKAWLLLPASNRADVAGVTSGVRVVGLNHRVFGRWLRPAVELLLYLLGSAGYFSRIVNVSNYGLCAPGTTPTVLYCHNALLVEEGHDQWSGEGGRPNWFKRWCLDSCLKRAEKVIVQTDHMASRMAAYAKRRGVKPVPIEVVRPLPQFPSSGVGVEKVFEFQFFYPASAFSHKRVALAMEAAVVANREDPRIGLVITCAVESAPRVACVRAVGAISHEAVMRYFGGSDALLFTSSLETLALPLLEAMEHRLPAVLPSLPYANDIYAEAGVYFNSDDVGAVASAVLRCVREYDARRAMVTERRDQEWKRRMAWSDHWAKFGVI
jgi:glycosyltransferase involved in cell wall biosynthesis